jgi:hypothetical protein
MQMVEDARHPTAGLQHGKHAVGRHEMRGRVAAQALWFGLPIAASCPHICNSPIRLASWLTSVANE